MKRACRCGQNRGVHTSEGGVSANVSKIWALRASAIGCRGSRAFSSSRLTSGYTFSSQRVNSRGTRGAPWPPLGAGRPADRQRIRLPRYGAVVESGGSAISTPISISSTMMRSSPFSIASSRAGEKPYPDEDPGGVGALFIGDAISAPEDFGRRRGRLTCLASVVALDLRSLADFMTGIFAASLDGASGGRLF